MALSLSELLAGSQMDQRPVILYVRGAQFKGVVVQVSEGYVDLRHADGQSLIRLESVDAITRE